MKPGTTRICSAALSGLAALVIQPGKALGDYRFDNPSVLNLSVAERLAPEVHGDPLAVSPLSAEAAATILASPDRNADADGQVPFNGEITGLRRAEERKRVAGEAAQVRRLGTSLLIRPFSGPGVVFKDSRLPKHADADVDSETFLYAGRVGADHYHRVEVLFAQDAPGSFFVNPANGRTAFAHNGADAVALSPGGQWLVSLDSLNSPFLVSVTRLGPDGPQVRLICHSDGTGDLSGASFKGWGNETSFDLTLSLGKAGESAKQVPLRIEYDGALWKPEAADPHFPETTGYACWR